MTTGGYSIYPGRSNVRSVGPQVSIAKDGRFSLNKAATKAFHEEAVERVLLKWNPSATRIALQDIKKKDARAFTVNYGKDGQRRGAGFNAKAFLESYVGYDLAKGRAFEAEWNPDERQLEFAVDAACLKNSKHTEMSVRTTKRA
jgi:hypothetical protein